MSVKVNVCKAVKVTEKEINTRVRCFEGSDGEGKTVHVIVCCVQGGGGREKALVCECVSGR